MQLCDMCWKQTQQVWVDTSMHGGGNRSGWAHLMGLQCQTVAVEPRVCSMWARPGAATAAGAPSVLVG